MLYREVEYHVVQTSSPTGWKLTVYLNKEHTRTGSGVNRLGAIALAQRAIDETKKGAPAIVETT